LHIVQNTAFQTEGSAMTNSTESTSSEWSLMPHLTQHRSFQSLISKNLHQIT